MTEISVDPLPPGVTRRSITSNTVYSLGVQSIGALFTIALTLFLVRALRPHEYGLLGLAIAIGGLVLLPAEFGVGGATGRYISQNYDNPKTLADIVRSALWLKFVLTGSTCLVLALIAPLVAELWNTPALAWALRAVAVVVFVQSTMSLLTSILTALGRVDLNLWVLLTESLLETGLAVTLVLSGGGAVGALSARAAGFGAATLVGAAIVRRVVGDSLWPTRTAGAWAKKLVRYGGALLVVDSAFALFGQIDILLIGAFLSTSAVGLFAAPLRFTALLLLPAGAITSAVAYRVGRRADWEVEKHSLIRASRFVLIFQAFTIAPLLIWATPMADVLFGGKGYGASANVLRALVPFEVLSGLGLLFSLTANYLGVARRRVPIALLTLAINFGLDIILIPRIGIMGAAIGTDVAYAFYAPAHAWICANILGLSLKPVARPALCVAIGAAAMSGILALFGTGHLSTMRIVLGGILGSAVYLTVVVGTGTITANERTTLFRKTSGLFASLNNRASTHT